MTGAEARLPRDGAREFERETDYRFSRFKSWCPQLAGCGVGLYGSGANARRILDDESRPFEVRAVVDDGAIGSQVCGMQVVGLDEALGNGVDTLVVAAEFASAAAVLQRIGSSCHEHGVRVFDLYGNDLLGIADALRELLFQSFEDQLRSIERCGTLCVNLDSLRDEHQAKTMAECARTGGKIGQCLVSAIGFARAGGKRIVFYSGDTGLTVESATVLLESKGLGGAGDLVLASEHGLFIENGLYRVLYERVPVEEAVHVGPDMLKDCLIPLSYGARAVLTRGIELADYLWFDSGAGADSPRGEWYEMEMQGLGPADERLRSCASAVMPDVCAGAEEGVARAVSALAPLVVGYTTWLVSRLRREEGTYPAVLFSARDGSLPKAVYDVFLQCVDDSPLPRSVYFYTSRKSSAVAAENDEPGMAQRANTLRYYDAIGLAPAKTYAFVEFVGAGTCQQQIECFAPFGLHGFYFGSRVGNCLTSQVDSEVYFDERDLGFLMRYLQIEPYLSSTEPSLEGFDEHGAPLFAQEPRLPAELSMLQDVQERVIRFAREYFARWYRRDDVIGHSYTNAIAPALDACDADALPLYDDLSGWKLSKKVGDFPSDPMEAGASDEGTLDGSGVHGASAPDGQESMRSDLLDILAAFDAACSEFGLSYVATHGTMLGAVREGGLIEGDDDLDVAMPRADYDRLLSLAGEGLFPAPFFLQTQANDAPFFCGGFAKLWRLRDGDGDGDSGGQRSLEGCAWMDIMPLDNCPRDDAAVERRQRVIRSIQRTIYAQTDGTDFSRIWDADPKHMSAYFILADHMSRERLCELLDRACSSSKPTGLLTVFAGNYREQRNRVRFEASSVEHAVRVPFENTTIPVPANAAEWLEKYYGPGWSNGLPQPE